ISDSRVSRVEKPLVQRWRVTPNARRPRSDSFDLWRRPRRRGTRGVQRFCTSLTFTSTRPISSDIGELIFRFQQFIGEAEEELLHEKPRRKTPPPPPPRRRSLSGGKASMAAATPITESDGCLSSTPFSRSAWGYSSLNSVARRKRVSSGWDRSHCGQASVDALLDARHFVDDHVVMDIGEIEKLTQALVLGLDNIDEDVQ
ncbi:hypothetical protein BIW11_12784, partial [Tropilaelaps mercedesae]